jgi:hypothetical protein
MTDDPNTPDDTPAAPAMKKPPLALLAGGGALVVLLLAALATRGGGPTPPRPSPRPVAVVDAATTTTPAPPRDVSPPQAPEVEAPVADAAVAFDGPPTTTIGNAPGAGDEVLRIFAPLRPGSMLGAARIERISVVVEGRIMVDLRVGAQRGSLAVMLASPAGARLIHAGPYVIYVHGEASPELVAAAPLLADALRQGGDGGVEVPPGLRPFALDARPR